MADNCLERDVNGGKVVRKRRDLAGPQPQQRGPMYGGPLLDELPLRPGRPEGMWQALPSASDLRAILQDHTRVVAGYEVLLSHYQTLLASLPILRNYAAATYDLWDADCDAKVGKRLLAMAGRFPGYDAAIDAALAAASFFPLPPKPLTPNPKNP